MELPAPGGGSGASAVSDGYGGKVEAAIGLCWGCWRRCLRGGRAAAGATWAAMRMEKR